MRMLTGWHERDTTLKRLVLIPVLFCILFACDESAKSISSVKKITCDTPLDDSFFEETLSFWKGRCESEKEDGLEMYERMCAEGHEIMCRRLEYSDCDRYQDNLNKTEKCRASGLTYRHRTTFIIDMESAKHDPNSFADMEQRNCWMDEPEERRSLPVKLTPENITLLFFEDENDVNIIINRQTLQGGIADSDITFSCSVEDVKDVNQL